MKTMKTLLLGFALAGCATIPNSQQVKIRAAHDFNCDADKVQVAEVDAKTMKASACGQEATYVKDCPYPEATRCTWISHGASDTAAAGSNSANP